MGRATGAILDPGRPRVFGIGLNKTGTTSLHNALEHLGFTGLHWGGPPVRRLVEAALEEGPPLLEDLDPAYDAFTDILALSENYTLLDRQYPGSRFVLTVRPVGQWIDSRTRHVLQNQRKKASGEYQGDFLEIEEEVWRDEWETHVGGVRRYFTGREDFVELDFSRDPTWAALCRLLGRPEPTEPFPWENRRPR